VSLIRCHECDAEISDIAFSCPKWGAPPKSAIKQSKHNQKIVALNNDLSRITEKNRKTKIVILVLIVVYGIATFGQQTIVDTVMYFGIFLAMLISKGPYHYWVKKIKRRIEINERLHDSMK
jgi:hypothetical protein